MLRSFRNLIVNLMAAFISDREARHKFRNKYRIKSKFRKLRDDNRRILAENKTMCEELHSLKGEILQLKENYENFLWEQERENSLVFHVTPLDNSPPKGPDSEVFLSIACVAKDEAPYLQEWIEYHKLVGVDRFYFYDNESNDNTKEVLESYIKDGTVVYHFLPNHPITKQRPQIEALNDAIFKYRDKTKWMAIIDADEFIVPVEKNSIPEFLAAYEQYPAVAVNWVSFDSNGHEKKPTAHGGLLTANYTRVRTNHNHRLDRTVKSIVNPRQVVNYISSHYGIYYQSNKAVTENFQNTRGLASKFHSSSKIRINHYISKSREEYAKKIARNHKGNTNYYKFNEAILNFPDETTEDLVIQKYLPQLKRVLGITD